MTADPQFWRKALLESGATLRDAIRSLEESAAQIAMVVSGGTLQGTVTDGDIRRGLLRGLTLEAPVEEVMWRDPLVAPPDLSRETVLQLMQVNRLHQLPIVNDRREVVGLHLWSELLVTGKRPNLMVIMAGGEGTRLQPFTETCPKPLLPVAGKPMLEHIIERAKADGFQQFVLAIHYLGHMIEEHFGDGSRWDIQIDYLREPSPLGTAGALGLLPAVPELPFIVSNGDVLTDIRYAELLDFHVHHGAAATMAVRMHEWEHPFGVVRTSGVDIVGFEEKPVTRTHINAGVYVLDPSVLADLRPGVPCDMPALFAGVRQRGARTIVYPMHEPWLDVGRPGDLEKAQSLT